MVNVERFTEELKQLETELKNAKRVLITAPGAADGDSIGAQLALRRMLLHRYSHLEVRIVNDEMLPNRYLFLPDCEFAETPEKFWASGSSPKFDVAICVDGGIDRAGRVRQMYEGAKTTVFIDHHAVSCHFDYKIRLVEPTASATTEVIYHISQAPCFAMPLERDFAQQIYLGLIFDTGFFRHSNTTPEAMELGAKLLRTGFDFTRVGERGMLERTFGSVKLLADTLSRAQLRSQRRVIWSVLTQKMLKDFHADDDDREGIIDHLFLTQGIEVAVLFFELPHKETKVSFRSQGVMDVATFARSLTERGGGHIKAAGANLSMPVMEAAEWVLTKLEEELRKCELLK